MRILLTVSYDGTNYSGWQRQQNSPTVQQTIEDTALFGIFKRHIHTTGASRTDAGVHALCQKVCFELFEEELHIPLEKLPLVLNAQLPPDIVITAAERVQDDFHPISDAKRKTYEYRILNSQYPDPKLRNYCEHVYLPLDYRKICEAAPFFVGEHDFAAFRAADGGSKTSVRTISSLETHKNDNTITITVTGNGFLYNMVRIIAGTLIYAGLGKLKPSDIPGIIESKDRARAGKTASPQGLTLIDVRY